jgi:hypothetical protein
MRHQPLLVTGLPRSGTSWTGKMLEAGGQVVYVNEPMSLSRPPGGSPGVLDAPVRHRFQYVDPADDEVWRAAFTDTLRLRFRPLRELGAVRTPYQLARGARYAAVFAMGSMRGRRAMLDDPNALFSAPWLTEVMGVRTVFVVRDPVGLIGSWRQLGWSPHLDALLAQPALVRDHLEPMADEIAAALGGGDWLEQMCCLWNVGNRFVDAARRSSDAVCVRRYEDLASEPMAQYESLYAWCGLDWSDRARDAVREATSAPQDHARAFSWSLRGGLSRTAFRRMDSRASVNRTDGRLAPDEVEQVRAATSEVLARFPRTTA